METFHNVVTVGKKAKLVNIWHHSVPFFHALKIKILSTGDILKFHFCLQIYGRSYHISEIEIVITFERNQILNSGKIIQAY